MNTLDDTTLKNAILDGGNAQGTIVSNGSLIHCFLDQPQMLSPTLVEDITIGTHTIKSERLEAIIKKLHMEMFPEDFV